jgi:hypothetical protein
MLRINRVFENGMMIGGGGGGGEGEEAWKREQYIKHKNYKGGENLFGLNKNGTVILIINKFNAIIFGLI